MTFQLIDSTGAQEQSFPIAGTMLPYNVISSYRDVFKRFLFRYINRDDWYVCVTKYDLFFLQNLYQIKHQFCFFGYKKIFFTVWVLNCKTFRYLVLVRKKQTKKHHIHKTPKKMLFKFLKQIFVFSILFCKLEFQRQGSYLFHIV